MSYELIVREGPVVIYSHNMLDPSQRDVFRGQEGLTIRELRPVSKQPMVVMLNGSFVLPEDEDWIPTQFDVLVFCLLPMGGGNISTEILGAILIVVGYVFYEYGGQYLIGLGIGLMAVGLIPTPKVPLANTSTPSPSPTYTLQLSGNSARLGDVIPVIYGRHILMPDFAAQPYQQYITVEPVEGPWDQYYYAFLCLGMLDSYVLESVMIDDTDISHFLDVTMQLQGPQDPGPITEVYHNCVNAPEVVGNTLEWNDPTLNQGLVEYPFVGPFAACGPGLTCNIIQCDTVAPKGLFYAADSGDLLNGQVTWEVQARTIDDLGSPTGDWVTLGSHSWINHTTTPVRGTINYSVALGRYEVQMRRTNPIVTDTRRCNDMQWAALKSFVLPSGALNSEATFMGLKMKASNQLSGLSQRRISVIVRRKLPTWNPSTGWSAPVETRSIAWAAADILRNTTYGAGIADSRIDLQTLYELDQEWTARGDVCNIVFDSVITVWTALQAVLRCGRARPLMRCGVFTFVRDEQQDLPTAMFNMRNIKSGSFNVAFVMMDEDTNDGVEIEYFDEITWSSQYVREPLPGLASSVFPLQVQLLGITTLAQATRECKYMVANAMYRRTTITFDTELEGFLPCFGDLIAVSHDIMQWGTSGEVVAIDEANNTITVSEDLDFSQPGNHFVMLTDQHGDPYGPYTVTPGAADRTMKFGGLPLDILYTGTEHDRTRFAFGLGTAYSTMCKVTGIVPKDDTTVTINAVVEDNRVYSYENT